MDGNHSKLDTIVKDVIKKVGKTIVLGTPLGAGKANHVINAFFQTAVKDPSILLTICTALTLEKPKGKQDLEQRFLRPFVERVFGDYPDLDYELARKEEGLPSNIKVIEFYFPPGKFLGNHEVQQNYISSNYTHVVRDMVDRKINVITQIVSKRESDGRKHFSMSCNPDVTLDMVKELKNQGANFATIAQVNQNLPFMFGDAVVDEDYFDFVLDEEDKYFTVFGPPKMRVSPADFMIGLYTSTLIKDDGELQIGIGSLGDSTVYNLLIRHQKNEVYQQIINDLNIYAKFGGVIERLGSTHPFSRGLFGASEMLVDGFMHLFKAGVIKKKVYDHIGLQTLINRGLIKENFDDDILEVLFKNKIIHGKLSQQDFDFLQEWGIFKEGLSYSKDSIIVENGTTIIPDLHEKENIEKIKKNCLGNQLQNGQIMQGGFFLGPQSFYSWLRDLPDEEKQLINMKSVQKINQLYGHEDLDRLHRKNARFVNSCMMHTLLGAAVSDGLENGQVVSGVGGQYNFVAMAQELPDGNSILNLRSTKVIKGKLASNIVPFYGHITIPRHLRDVVITEYGIANIRGCTDEEIIHRLLSISDSRFQGHLLSWAKEVGKVKKDYQIPQAFTNNYPESYQGIIKKYQKLGLYNPYPFGTDFTPEELVLGQALKELKEDLKSKPKLIVTLIKGLFQTPSKEQESLLQRMDLLHPKNIKERVYKILLLSKLNSRP